MNVNTHNMTKHWTPMYPNKKIQHKRDMSSTTKNRERRRYRCYAEIVTDITKRSYERKDT